MSQSINKVILIGKVGTEPEIRMSQAGKRFANFRLATSESWKDKATGDRKERTEWHSIAVTDDKLCDVISRFVHKGSKVYVEGSIQTRKWTDQSGTEKQMTEIVIRDFSGKLVLLDGAKEKQPPRQDVFGIPDEVPY